MFFVVGTNLYLNFGFIGNGWVKLASFSKYVCNAYLYYYLLLFIIIIVFIINIIGPPTVARKLL